MTSVQLVDLLVAQLVRDHGGPKQHWRKLVGAVRLYDIATHAHCNWAIEPSGTHAEVRKIETLLDELRGRHPLISSHS